MMKKLIILLLLPSTLIAQENQYNITWESNLLFESNGLHRAFLNSMLFGGNITDVMKSEWIASGNKNNIINSNISNGLSITYNFNKENIGFSFTDVNILNVSLTDDLLRLAFEGNFHHQGKILDFSGTSISATSFQQYKVTYGRARKNLKINGGISYLAGNHHLSYLIKNGSLYTAPLGTYLDVEYSMNAFITDTSNFSAFTNNGNGVAFDLSTDLDIQKYQIHFSLSNLGFIMWNTSSVTLATDSTFSFQGIEVDDIFNFNDSVLDANNIEDDIIKTKNNPFKSYIPATVILSVSGSTEFKYLKTYNAGIIAKWQPYMDNTLLSFSKINQGFRESNYKPLYYIHSVFNTRYYDVLPSLSYGGYSENTQIGLAISKGKKNKFVIGTHHLEDVFNGDKAEAVSLYFNIQIKF